MTGLLIYLLHKHLPNCLLLDLSYLNIYPSISAPYCQCFCCHCCACYYHYYVYMCVLCGDSFVCHVLICPRVLMFCFFKGAVCKKGCGQVCSLWCRGQSQRKDARSRISSAAIFKFYGNKNEVNDRDNAKYYCMRLIKDYGWVDNDFDWSFATTNTLRKKYNSKTLKEHFKQ